MANTYNYTQRKWWERRPVAPASSFGLPGTGAAPGSAFMRIDPGHLPPTNEYVSYGYPRDWGGAAGFSAFDAFPWGNLSQWSPGNWANPREWSSEKWANLGQGTPGNWWAGLNQLGPGDGGLGLDDSGREVRAASAGTALAPTGDRAVQASMIDPGTAMVVSAVLGGLFGGGKGGGGGGASAGQEALLGLAKQFLQNYGGPLLERGMNELESYSPENVSRQLARYRGTAETAANTALTRALAQASQRGLEYGSWLPGIQGQIAGELGKGVISEQADLEAQEKARIWQQLLSLLSAIPGMSQGAGQAAAGYGSLAASQNEKDKQWGATLAAMLNAIGNSGKSSGTSSGGGGGGGFDSAFNAWFMNQYPL